MDHEGRVLSLVDEAPVELKGTGVKKAKVKPAVVRAQPKRRESSPEPISGTDSYDSENSAPGARKLAPARFIPAGRTSPSGNATKRARVEGPHRAASPSGQDTDQRPVNPLPTRKGGNDKKRKRPDVASPARIDPWKQVDHAEPVPVMHWPNPNPPLPARGRHAEPANDTGVPLPAMRATTPMYPPPSFPQPFGLQPPYAPHAGFPPYGPSGYAPPYGPPGWVHPSQHGTHQQWPTGQPQFNQEDFDVMMQMRQGGYHG